MRFLARLGTIRTVVALLALSTGLQMAFIAFGNITDFGTNQAFVVHVLAMDTTFESPHTMWRAITSAGVADAAYIAIIAWETISAIVLIAAFVAWVLGRTTGARQLSIVGWLMWVLLFGLGFIAIGGEWFEMWQSSKWNGLQPALQNLIIASVGLILTALVERSADSKAHDPVA
jgi:predicted small integral membrane protein